jgi:hypothetical protein
MTKMKKEPMGNDSDIDEFLKCQRETSEFQLDDQKLANEIKTKARRSKVFTNFSYVILPLAACFVALISWQIKDKLWSMNEKVAHSMYSTQELDFASDLSSEDLELLDDWLLAAPDFVDFFSVDYDTSYELLVSLETIPLP